MEAQPSPRRPPTCLAASSAGSTGSLCPWSHLLWRSHAEESLACRHVAQQGFQTKAARAEALVLLFQKLIVRVGGRHSHAILEHAADHALGRSSIVVQHPTQRDRVVEVFALNFSTRVD